MTACCSEQPVLLHYVGESKTYYVDLGNAIRGRTITGVTSVASDDSALSFASAAVISVDTTEYDQYGNAITIEANTGVQFTMSGGTAGDADDEYTATLTITFTTSAGTEVNKDVRVKVL